MDFSPIKLFEPGQLTLESVILDDDILVLVDQIVELELKLGKLDFLSTELVLEFDEFILEFDAGLSLVIKIVFELLFCFLKLLPFVL